MRLTPPVPGTSAVNHSAQVLLYLFYSSLSLLCPLSVLSLWASLRFALQPLELLLESRKTLWGVTAEIADQRNDYPFFLPQPPLSVLLLVSQKTSRKVRGPYYSLTGKKTRREEDERPLPSSGAAEAVTQLVTHRRPLTPAAPAENQ